jgi:predicted DNA-binding transcriptional regulator YafY
VAAGWDDHPTNSAAVGNLDPITALPEPAPLERKQAVVHVLRHALASRQAVSMTYYTAGRETWTRRIVYPLALEQRFDEWYLHAYCTARKAERVFRVDRVGEVMRMSNRAASELGES